MKKNELIAKLQAIKGNPDGHALLSINLKVVS